MSEGLGGIGGLMKQAQEMQAKFARIQKALAKKTVEATSGGGMVRVTVSGEFTLVSIKVDPAVIDPEEVEMLEDLVRAAVNEGLWRARKMIFDEMNKHTGGFNIPGLTL